jgi:hypothetical protein
MAVQIQLVGERWEALLTRNGETAVVHCETRADAEAIADVGPVMALFDAGGKCGVDRVRRCMASLARSVYRLPHNLARELYQFEKDLAKETDNWA